MKENESEDLLGNFQYKPSTPAKHDHVILDMQAGARISFNGRPSIWSNGLN